MTLDRSPFKVYNQQPSHIYNIYHDMKCIVCNGMGEPRVITYLSYCARDRQDQIIIDVYKAAGLVYGGTTTNTGFCSVNCFADWADANPEKVVIEMALV